MERANQTDIELLSELDGQEHQLMVGWSYLREQLRRALASGDFGPLEARVLPAVTDLLQSAGRQEVAPEYPPLQMLEVDRLDDEHVLYRLREVTPSRLADCLVGRGLLLEARVACVKGIDWRLRELSPARAPSPDCRVIPGLRDGREELLAHMRSLRERRA